MAIDPFVFQLAIFALTAFVGYALVRSATPALRIPLTSAATAIASVIVVGALLSSGADASQLGEDGPLWARLFGFIALVLASTSIFGGYLIARRLRAADGRG